MQANKIRGLMLLCLLFASGYAMALNRYVATNGLNQSPYTNWSMAATNLQTAITAAQAGEMVWLSNGIFAVTGQISVTTAITIKGYFGREATVLAGGYPVRTNRCFNINNASAWLDSLTISNFGCGANYGGGVYLTSGNITNCHITCNYAVGGWAAGVWIGAGPNLITDSKISYNSGSSFGGGFGGTGNGNIRNCEIYKNNAGNGGAMFINGSGIVANCVMRDNTAVNGGVASVSAAPNGQGLIYRNCLMIRNLATTGVGGALSWASNTYSLVNCTIVSNRAAAAGGAGGGINLGSDYRTAGSNFINCIIYSNSATYGKDIYMGSGASTNFFFNCCVGYSVLPANHGNITNYPIFANADPANPNYRLQANSPCINTGSNQAWMAGTTDLDGNARPDTFSGLADMGVYEYIPTLNAVSGMSGGHVTYTYQIGLSEVKVSDYISYLNASDTNDEITVSAGQVLKAGSSTPYCLTQAADTNAPVIYDSGLPAGQRFSAVVGRENHPMVFVSWFGAAAYCNWKSDQEGFVKVYNPAGGWTAVTTNSGYRLPTEKEWRKAAAWNSGSNSFYAYGTSQNTITNTDANYLFSGDSYETNVVATCPVNAYTPSSPYWLKDASGNVWEWCQDFYDQSGYNEDVDAHAVRGGSWGNLSTDVRASGRSGLMPGYCEHTVGFRVARQTGQ